jgi:hypothetical protein
MSRARCDRYDMWVYVYNGVIITSMSSFMSSIKGKVVSIMRRVHKSSEGIPRGRGVWGMDLVMFGCHFTWWGKQNCMKTLIL